MSQGAVNGSGAYSATMHDTHEPRCRCGHGWKVHGDRALIACTGLAAGASAVPPYGREHQCRCLGYEAA